MDELTQAAQSFLERYRITFETLSAPSIAEHFAYPVHITGDDGGRVTLAVAESKDPWIQQLQGLLGLYRAIDVRRAEAVDIAFGHATASVVQARVRWALSSGANDPLYEFDASYTIARTADGLRVVAIAHDELTHYRACRARLGK